MPLNLIVAIVAAILFSIIGLIVSSLGISAYEEIKGRKLPLFHKISWYGLLICVFALLGLLAGRFFGSSVSSQVNDEIPKSSETPTLLPLDETTPTIGGDLQATIESAIQQTVAAAETISPTIEITPTNQTEQAPRITSTPIPLDTLLSICSGQEPLQFLDGLPSSDPCGGVINLPVFDPGTWIVINPVTRDGQQEGRCLYHYPNTAEDDITEGLMWVLRINDSVNGDLPNCPETRVVP
jgi:hypothetical protein